MGSCTSTLALIAERLGISSDWALPGGEPVVESEGGQENFSLSVKEWPQG